MALFLDENTQYFGTANSYNPGESLIDDPEMLAFSEEAEVCVEDFDGYFSDGIAGSIEITNALQESFSALEMDMLKYEANLALKGETLDEAAEAGFFQRIWKAIVAAWNGFINWIKRSWEKIVVKLRNVKEWWANNKGAVSASTKKDAVTAKAAPVVFTGKAPEDIMSIQEGFWRTVGKVAAAPVKGVYKVGKAVARQAVYRGAQLLSLIKDFDPKSPSEKDLMAAEAAVAQFDSEKYRISLMGGQPVEKSVNKGMAMKIGEGFLAKADTMIASAEKQRNNCEKKYKDAANAAKNLANKKGDDFSKRKAQVAQGVLVNNMKMMNVYISACYTMQYQAFNICKAFVKAKKG